MLMLHHYITGNLTRFRESEFNIDKIWGEYTNQKTVTSCCLGEPRKSVFVRCSRIQTTVPTKRKKLPVTAHICHVNGMRNDHGFVLTSFIGATTTSPDSINGCVKSTILVLFVVIVKSPTAASYFCK